MCPFSTPQVSIESFSRPLHPCRHWEKNCGKVFSGKRGLGRGGDVSAKVRRNTNPRSDELKSKPGAHTSRYSYGGLHTWQTSAQTPDTCTTLIFSAFHSYTHLWKTQRQECCSDRPRFPHWRWVQRRVSKKKTKLCSPFTFHDDLADTYRMNTQRLWGKNVWMMKRRMVLSAFAHRCVVLKVMGNDSVIAFLFDGITHNGGKGDVKQCLYRLCLIRYLVSVSLRPLLWTRLKGKQRFHSRHTVTC